MNKSRNVRASQSIRQSGRQAASQPVSQYRVQRAACNAAFLMQHRNRAKGGRHKITTKTTTAIQNKCLT